MLITFKTLKKISKNLSILYVEDDLSLQEASKKTFENLFNNVDIAIDGVDGFQKYLDYYDDTQKHYDIVISDIQMPKLNGIELTKKIFTINKKQKIIITSAYDDKKYLVDLINIGVEAFMEKPISSEQMLDVLWTVCDSLQSEGNILLKDDFSYQTSTSTLFFKNKKIELSDNESKLLELLMSNNHQSFNCIDIFNYLYFDEVQKDFSQDSIKSLIKRLRKKIPKNLISNTQQLGYSVNLES